LVIPLLFENNLDALVEESWLVAVHPALQRTRLIERDGFSPEEADRRMAAQMPLDDKLERATRVIWNNHDRWVLARAVDETWLAAGLSR
jgi:dephospho-CoA kinase